jgi:monoamine oxidase
VRDLIVVGGGFAGVTAAREASLRGLDVLLLEARDRLGGRTWTADWDGLAVELGGGYVHWHQPHTFAEITRAGLTLAETPPTARAWWTTGTGRHSGSLEERDAIARRGWDRFVEGSDRALPLPHEPLAALDELARFDALTIAQRIDQLELDAEERDVLVAELESVSSGPLDEAGAVSILRWHALSGRSLALTQETGGQVVLVEGTGALLAAIAGQGRFETRLRAPVAAVRGAGAAVELRLRDGETLAARAVVVAVPLNALGAIAFEPALSAVKREGVALGQASRGLKIFIRARGPGLVQNAISPGHPFGYLSTDRLLGDGTQVMIGFGLDAQRCDPADLAAVQSALDEILPGYEAVAATAHDWLADEFSRGTWAIHRPGWYTRYHAELQRPEGHVLLAGSDIANGWSGFIDGAIESGLRAAAQLPSLLAS